MAGMSLAILEIVLGFQAENTFNEKFPETQICCCSWWCTSWIPAGSSTVRPTHKAWLGGGGVSNRGRNKTNPLVCNSKSKHSNPVCAKHNSNLRHLCSWKIVNGFEFCSGTIMFPARLETVPSTVWNGARIETGLSKVVCTHKHQGALCFENLGLENTAKTPWIVCPCVLSCSYLN